VYQLGSSRKDKIVCHTSEMIRHELRAIPFALRLMKRNQYDLNHSHFIFPDGPSAVLLRKITGLPVILTAHGSDVPGYNPDRFTYQHKALAPIWQTIVGNVERIVCPSQHLRSLMLAKRPKLDTHVIPNGLDPQKFHPWLKKEPKILVVTRMLRRKGVQQLLKAVEAWHLPHEINIVGDGPYLQKLKEMGSGSTARIKFWGWLENDSDELRELYETSSVFVSLSSDENFPVNLLEAMAAGMAIVTNPDTGSGEVVGDCAFRVDPNKPAEVRAALIQLMESPDLAEDLGRRARQRFEQCFTWRAVAMQYDRLYRELKAVPHGEEILCNGGGGTQASIQSSRAARQDRTIVSNSRVS
jgi:glycosyltransferase involved in cell wall biosynthesis